MGISDYLKGMRAKVGHAPIMMPSVCVIILNDRNEVLLHRQSGDGLWHTIGGSMDPQEEPAAAAVREALEETGLQVVPERVVSVYAGPDMTYPNQDVVWYVTICFACRVSAGEAKVADDESLEVRWFGAGELPALTMHDRRAIEQALTGERETRYYAP